MPDRRRARCQTCGKRADEVGLISWRGNCRPCGLAREINSILEQQAHAGPHFDRWRQRLAASVGAALRNEPGRD